MEKIPMIELAAVLSEKFGMGRREAQRFVETFADVAKDGIENEKLVKIKGLGTFKVIDVDARESVNVNTGERVTIDSHSKLTFTPDNAMKELVNKPFSQFETVVLNDGVDFADEEEPAIEDTADDDENVVEPEPAPIVKPEPAPIVEPEPVPVVEPEPTSIVEPAPVVEPEPAPVVEPEPAPVYYEQPTSTASVIGTKVPAEEPVEKEDKYEDEEEDEDEPTRHSRWWLWLLLALIACGLSFFGGYYFGQKKAQTGIEPQPIPTDTLVVAAADTLRTSLPADTLQTSADTIKADTTAVVASVPEKAEPEPDYKKYEEMDVRVRTGAYNIVGTAQVVKVLPGDNTRRLAKRYLGDGMACYIEVYNGITSSTQLEPGQEIKIPALKWKTKSKSKKN